MELGQVIDKLYASLINFEISTMFDGGVLVRLGDDLNGYEAETYVRTGAEAAAWLDAEVRRRYPKSFCCGLEGYGLREKPKPELKLVYSKKPRVT